jgi:hypothetical protein
MEYFFSQKWFRIFFPLVYLLYSFFLNKMNNVYIWPWEKIGIIGGTTGLTRGLHFILTGDIIKGIRYHPLSPIILFLLLGLILLTIIEIIFKKNYFNNFKISILLRDRIIYLLIMFIIIRMIYHFNYGFPI